MRTLAPLRANSRFASATADLICSSISEGTAAVRAAGVKTINRSTTQTESDALALVGRRRKMVVTANGANRQSFLNIIRHQQRIRGYPLLFRPGVYRKRRHWPAKSLRQ